MPLPARIGIYLIFAGLLFNFLLQRSGDTGQSSVFTLLVAIGGFLVLASAISLLLEKWRASKKPVSLTVPGPQPESLKKDDSTAGSPSRGASRLRPRFPLRPRFAPFPDFPLLCCIGLSGLVFFHVAFGPRPSLGFQVSLVRPVIAPYAPWRQGVVVRLAEVEGKSQPRLCVNSKRVQLEQMHEAIEDAFQTVPGRTVYVYADPEMEYQSAGQIIDALKGMHARVILLTPATVGASPLAGC